MSYGTQNLVGVGMWTYVYRLIVWLPARTVPLERGARPAQWHHFLIASGFPLMFVIPMWVWLGWTGARAAWRRTRRRSPTS